VRKGGILDNICKGVNGGNRVASLKYAFRLISVGGDYIVFSIDLAKSIGDKSYLILVNSPVII